MRPNETVVRGFILVAFALGLGVGVSTGCKKKTTSPEDGGNLCTKYSTCDECIAGEQADGASKGEAQTVCGAAVTGCWTTWEKPIVCAGKEHKGKR